MALKKYEETDIAAIASAIREKTGCDKTYKVSQMDEGVNEVYEAGKKAEYDAFWDVYQENGKRFSYYYAFGGTGWNDETFKPKYDIVPTGSALQMFIYCEVTNIAERLRECGVTLDISKVGNCQGMFAYAKTVALPLLDMSSATNATNLCVDCKNLVTIEKLISTEKVFFGTTSFSNCNSLQNIIIEGRIGQNFDIHWSPLSKESIKSIMSHLSSTSTFTVTLSQTAVNNAFTTDEWQEIINAKPTNVTVSLI